MTPTRTTTILCALLITIMALAAPTAMAAQGDVATTSWDGPSLPYDRPIRICAVLTADTNLHQVRVGEYIGSDPNPRTLSWFDPIEFEADNADCLSLQLDTWFEINASTTLVEYRYATEGLSGDGWAVFPINDTANATQPGGLKTGSLSSTSGSTISLEGQNADTLVDLIDKAFWIGFAVLFLMNRWLISGTFFAVAAIFREATSFGVTDATLYTLGVAFILVEWLVYTRLPEIHERIRNGFKPAAQEA